MPLSRRTVRFRMLPLINVGANGKEDDTIAKGRKGEWVRVNFVVRDRYFQKILKIVVTEDMRADKDGVLVWVPASFPPVLETRESE